MKKIIMTGATSMIGVALVESCIANGVQVLALVRGNTKRLDRLPKSPLLTVADCDITQLYLYKSSECDFDVFYHLAWLDTSKSGRKDPTLQADNIRCALDAVRLAKRMGCTGFVGAGSQGEYGQPLDGLTGPDTQVKPSDAYGVCKYAAGLLCKQLCEQLGMNFAWLRVFSVYGRYALPDSILSVMVKKLLAGEHCAFTAATQIWDFLDCADAGRAFYLAGEKNQGSNIYCLGSGIGLPLKSYLEQVRDMIDPAATLGFGEIPYSTTHTGNLCADNTTLCRDLDWRPEVTFAEGMLKMIDGIKQETENAKNADRINK